MKTIAFLALIGCICIPGTDTFAQQSSLNNPLTIPQTTPTPAPLNGFFAVLVKDIGQKIRVLPNLQFPNKPVTVNAVPIVSAADIASATPGFSLQGMPLIDIVLTPRGTSNFAAFTAANIGKPLAIIVNDQVLSAPTIVQAITEGKVQISGRFTVEETTRLAIAIKGPN